MMQRGRAAPERARGSRGRGDGGTAVLVGHGLRRGIRPGARAVRRVGLAAPAASGGLFPRLARLALAGDRPGAARLEHLLKRPRRTCRRRLRDRDLGIRLRVVGGGHPGVLCVFLLPFVLSSRVYTMPEFLERRYDGRARLYFAALTLFLSVTVDAAAALYSGSLVIRVLFPGSPLWVIIVALAGAAGLYTVLGGLRAVIYTEAVQGVLILFGAVVIASAAFSHAGGWHTVMTSVPPSALSLIRPAGDPGVPWPGLLFGIPVLGFYYWCTNQCIVQRVLSARTLEHGRAGALFAGFLKLPVLFLMVLPGTCAIVLFPHLPRADLVYPSLVFRLLPAGVLGLWAGEFWAAAMASVASTLNSTSALITMDIIRRIAPTLSDRKVVRIGRLCAAVLLLVAMLWAPQLEPFPSLWPDLPATPAHAVAPIA